jgi:hypothetical protein
MWALGSSFPKLFTKFVFNCFLWRSCLQRSFGNLTSTAGVAHDRCHFMKTAASSIQNPEKLNLSTIKYVNTYTYFGQSVSLKLLANVSKVNVYRDF